MEQFDQPFRNHSRRCGGRGERGGVEYQRARSHQSEWFHLSAATATAADAAQHCSWQRGKVGRELELHLARRDEYDQRAAHVHERCARFQLDSRGD